MILARLDTWLARLNQAKLAIESKGLDTRLHARIGADLSNRLSQQMKELGTRRKKIGSDSTLVKWRLPDMFACERLLDECLIFLQAARSRGPDVEPDLCEITDTLFEELAEKLTTTAWRKYSVFSTEDSFDAMTNIVRLRYPISSVWDIPVAVHEFGHFISGQLARTLADGSKALVFQDYKPAVAQQKEREASAVVHEMPPTGPLIDWKIYLEELFADVFATYAAGPSFAYSAVLLRFDPVTSMIDIDGKHPPYAVRTYAIVATLRRMDREPVGQDEMDSAIQTLENFWRDACLAAGTEAVPPEAMRDWIDAQVWLIYGWLKDAEPGLRFSGWNSADARTRLLETPLDAKRPAEAFTIVELLNIAWLCRFKSGSNQKGLHQNFVALARLKTAKYGVSLTDY